MNLSDLLPEVKKRRDLRKYYPTVFEFVGYINSTRAQRFRFRGVTCHVDNIDPIVSEVEYIHRWTLPYVKGWKKKLYLLDDWYQSFDDPPSVTMVTLTTYQAGKYSMEHLGRPVLIPESFELQKWGWDRLYKLLRQDFGKFDYVSIVEPHLKNDTGYPHTHVPVFMDIDDFHRRKYEEKWEKKYKIGSKEHGLNFAVADEGTKIESLRNYIGKYLSKGFLSFDSKFGEGEITPGHLVFHAIAWKHQHRIFGASRNLSKVMEWDRAGNDVDWLSTSILQANGEENLVWMADDREGMMKMKEFVNQEFGVEFE